MMLNDDYLIYLVKVMKDIVAVAVEKATFSGKERKGDKEKERERERVNMFDFCGLRWYDYMMNTTMVLGFG